MSAPTNVIRTSASVVDEPKSGQNPAPEMDWAQYVKWGLIGALALAAIGLTSSLYVTYAEKSATNKLRAEWDEYHSALSEKKSDDDRMEALEKLAENPKIKGTAVHAFVLAALAHANFEIGQNPRRQVETRAAALERAILLNRMLATTEPFKSHPSFGPFAVQNLALALEQKQTNDPGTQFYDEAIKGLHASLYKDESKDADALKDMKKHFLFNKLNAQLGRLYWLRGLRKAELEYSKLEDERKKSAKPDPAAKPEDVAKANEVAQSEERIKASEAAKADNEWALFYIKPALESGTSSVEKDRYGADFKGAWRQEAAYIKSLIDPVGKMMPDGKAPPMKVEVKKEESKKDEPKTDKPATPATPPTPPATPAPTSPATPATPTTPTTPVTPAPVTPPADKPKTEEPKKAGSLQRSDSQESVASETGSSQHMTYAQIQAMIKQGRSAMCQCPRCANSDKAVGAKLAE